MTEGNRLGRNTSDKTNDTGGTAPGRDGTKPLRGFAALDAARRSEVARKGGAASGGNFRNDPDRAASAGRKGGERSGGNFKHDPSRAAEAGRKGGQASQRPSDPPKG